MSIKDQKWCTRASECVDAKSPSNPPVTQEWGRVRVVHSGSAVSLFICRFLWHHWVPICQASGDENCMRRIDIAHKDEIILGWIGVLFNNNKKNQICIHHHYPCNEKWISFFIFRSTASSLLGCDETSVAVFPCCRLVRMDMQLLSIRFP